MTAFDIIAAAKSRFAGVSYTDTQTLTSAQQALARTNIGAIGNLASITRYTASQTWNRPANCKGILVRAWGAGGGSGGAASNSGSALSASGGAGGGELREIFISSPDASYAMTIGAGGTAGAAGNNNGGDGGDTSFGTVLTAKGGKHSNGAGSNAQASTYPPGLGGSGGSGGTGSPGSAGSFGVTFLNAYTQPGQGGASPGGGGVTFSNGGQAAAAGQAPGGGAAGVGVATGGSALAGAVGGAGAIDVWVFQ
jgi:hypothetical protein